MVEKSIDSGKLAKLMLQKFVEMGMLEEKGSGKKKLYFLTDNGRMILANFGIEEAELY